MQKKQSAKFLRKRKFMLVLPLLTIPFITMAFWALGGGKDAEQNQRISESGLNLELPDANLKDVGESNKLSFYDKAKEDSIRLRKEMLNDPFYKDGLDTTREPVNNPLANSVNKLNTSPYHSLGSTDVAEAKINERIDVLNKAIQHPANSDSKATEHISSIQMTEGRFSANVDRLENMMQVMNENNADDPEMKQLGSMLDKILDIQHPERVKEKIKERSETNKQMVYAVNKHSGFGSASLLDTSKKKLAEQTGFFGIEEENSSEQNAIEAVVHGTQTLVDGAVVKLRLLDNIYISGRPIPNESFVFGLASLNGERLQIEITSIRAGSSLFPVKLEAYDVDGLAGIYTPGAITRDVAKQSADNSLRLLNLGTMNPSLKAQATAAGIDATKNLLSRKVKLVKVTVKAGYKVLLKNKQ